MPMVPRKRGVSRSRYERLVKAALETYNQEIMAYNVEVAWWNNEYHLRGGKNYGGQKKTRRLLTEADAFGSRKRPAAFIRFRIFRDLHAAGYSLPSIGMAACQDHTTILSGIRRIEALEPLPVLIHEATEERPTGHASPNQYIEVAELTERAANFNEPLTLVEVPVVAVLH